MRVRWGWSLKKCALGRGRPSRLVLAPPSPSFSFRLLPEPLPGSALASFTTFYKNPNEEGFFRLLRGIVVGS